MKKQMRLKEPIKVRMKKLSNGCQSIYLDIYMDGKRQYEFLKLYIIPEYNKTDKIRNRETLNLVNNIKSQKILELQNKRYGFFIDKPSDIRLVDYLNKIARSDTGREARKANIKAVIHHLERYNPEGILLSEVDKTFILGFIEYLKNAKQSNCKKAKTLHANTQLHYFKVLRYCLNYAVSEEQIAANPIDRIRNDMKPKHRRTEREYLTISELKCLVRTPFYNTLLKKAFLFSCFCGLRHCDIVKLQWKDLHYDDKGNALISIIQQKTQEAISLPLSSEALKYLPKREIGRSTDKIFDGLISLGRSNEVLDRWAELAGLTKHITFHVARHTHATMMLTLGADLYTISKLLGHKNIQATQVYAKLVDESKRKAVALIPDIS